MEGTVNAVVTELIKRGRLLRPDVGIKLVDQRLVRRSGFPNGVMIGEIALLRVNVKGDALAQSGSREHT